MFLDKQKQKKKKTNQNYGKTFPKMGFKIENSTKNSNTNPPISFQTQTKKKTKQLFSLERTQ